jgi:hypothetical protein
VTDPKLYLDREPTSPIEKSDIRKNSDDQSRNQSPSLIDDIKVDNTARTDPISIDNTSGDAIQEESVSVHDERKSRKTKMRHTNKHDDNAHHRTSQANHPNDTQYTVTRQIKVIIDC